MIIQKKMVNILDSIDFAFAFHKKIRKCREKRQIIISETLISRLVSNRNNGTKNNKWINKNSRTTGHSQIYLLVSFLEGGAVGGPSSSGPGGGSRWPWGNHRASAGQPDAPPPWTCPGAPLPLLWRPRPHHESRDEEERLLEGWR